VAFGNLCDLFQLFCRNTQQFGHSRTIANDVLDKRFCTGDSELRFKPFAWLGGELGDVFQKFRGSTQFEIAEFVPWAVSNGSTCSAAVLLDG